MYDARSFAASGIELQFLDPRLMPYRQFSESFVPGLSIVDAMMFCRPEQVSRLLDDYALELP